MPLVIRPLQDPPYKSPMLDDAGLLTPAWQRWINEIYFRMGQKQAPTNAQLKALIDELELRVAALEP